MSKEKDPPNFIKPPQYPGGKRALQKFVKENLKYPKKAVENHTEGKVHISFQIEFDGSVKEATILSGIGDGCDKEALRLVKMLVYKPQPNRKVKVRAKSRINIQFKLPEATVGKASQEKEAPTAIVHTENPKESDKIEPVAPKKEKKTPRVLSKEKIEKMINKKPIVTADPTPQKNRVKRKTRLSQVSTTLLVKKPTSIRYIFVPKQP